MAILDFPASPTVGQKYPTTPVLGQPMYTWDGEKWTTVGGLIGDTGAATELPLMDGIADAGVSLKWVREDHVHPSDTSRAAVIDVTASLDTKVDVAGDTMTGDLTITKPNPAFILDKTADTQDTILRGRKNGLERWAFDFGSNAAESGGNAGSDFILYGYDDAGAYLNTPLTITRSTGLATVKADPTGALGIATKAYVDLASGQTFSLAGGTSTDVTVPAGKNTAKISVVIFASSATASLPVLQVSLQAGVFKTTAGDYHTNGFSHATNAPNTIVTTIGDTTRVGIMMAGTQTNLAIPLLADGILTVRRPDTSHRFGALFRGSFTTTAAYIQTLYQSSVLDIAHPSLNILAFRIMSPSGDSWANGSYVRVDWI